MLMLLRGEEPGVVVSVGVGGGVGVDCEVVTLPHPDWG